LFNVLQFNIRVFSVPVTEHAVRLHGQEVTAAAVIRSLHLQSNWRTCCCIITQDHKKTLQIQLKNYCDKRISYKDKDVWRKQ